jgi:hypothetical protein
MSKVGLEGLSSAIGSILAKYGEDVAKSTAEAVPKVARKAAKALREESQRTFGSTDGKYRYAKGWKAQTDKGRVRTTAVVYNADAPGLAHLLEHGHANVDGGRTPGRAHIAPVEQMVLEQFEKELEEKL